MPAKSAIAFGTGYGRDGGFRYFGADGKLHWVPPWNPEISRDFSIAATLANRAEHVTDRSVRAQIEGTPIKVVTTTTFTDIADVVGLRTYIGNDPANTNPKLTVVQQTQITGISPADVDPKLFATSESSGPPQ